MSAHKNKQRKNSATGAGAARRTAAPSASSAAKGNSAARSATAPRPATAGVTARPVATAARPVNGQTANGKAPAGKPAGSAAVVRRTAVTPAGYRSRMNRAARQRRQQSLIAGAVVGVVVLGGLGALLYNQLPFFHTQAAAPHAPKCTTNAQTGLSGTPATAGGPPAVTGKLVALDQCLQYIDVKVGTGAAVKAGDKVTVQYTGWLENGTKFDSSADHPGQPFSFVVGQGRVIQGWDKGLVGMKVGGERRLIIPAALGYGAQGYPPTIPANATLIFDVTIVSIG
jgi:FKBP-type peptidyl-prolyl cis-trans isomerase